MEYFVVALGTSLMNGISAPDLADSPPSYGREFAWAGFQYIVLGLLPLWMVGSAALFQNAGGLWGERLRDGTLISFSVVVLVVEFRNHLMGGREILDRVAMSAAGFAATAFLVFYANLTLNDALVIRSETDPDFQYTSIASDQLRTSFSITSVIMALAIAATATYRHVYRAQQAHYYRQLAQVGSAG